MYWLNDYVTRRMLMSGKTFKTGFTPENILYTPQNIVSFISDLVSYWKPRKVLDPACGSGSFFPAINSALDYTPEFLGVDISPPVIRNAEENLKDLTAELVNADFFQVKDRLDKYDLIVSQPSFVQLQEAVEIRGFEIVNLEYRFLMECLDLLEDNGYLVMVLPEQKSFFNSHTHHEVREFLLDNYSVEASISLPLQTTYPYSSIKTCIFILKNAPQRDKVFFAQFNQSTAPIILENYLEAKANDNCSQGFWVNGDKLRGKGCMWTYDYFRALDELKKKKTRSPYPLKNILEICELGDFNAQEEVILLPHKPEEDVILKSELEEEEELDKYYQIRLKSEYVSPQFLIRYLNSDSMKNERNILATGSVQRTLKPQALDSLYIELPDLKQQNRIVYTGQKADEIYQLLKTEYQDFKRNIFNYPELLDLLNKFDLESEIFYNKLIWPFASSYMLVKEDHSPNTTLNNYFKFFELISAFNSIVLLSALPREIYHQEKDYIWQTGQADYSKATFGLWVALYSRLRGVYQEMVKETYNLLPFGREFYWKLVQKKVIKNLNPIIEKRNEWTHGGVTPDVCADKIITDMNNYLNNIYDAIRIYNPLKLIYPTAMSKNRGIYTITSKNLEGTSYPFPIYQFQTEEDMDTNQLYLYDPVTDDRLELIPELIRLVECSKCGSWSLYLYNSQTPQGIKYISYQYEVHEYLEKISDQPENLANLIDY